MRGWRGVGFAIFCLLAGSRWLLEDAFSSTVSPLWRQATHFAAMGLVVLVVWRRSLPDGWGRFMLAGGLLFGVPAILDVVAGPVVDHAGAALFTLVPLCVVVGVAASSGDESRALMMPALLGAAGGLLVLPFALPSTAYGGVLFGVALVAVLSTAVGGIWLHRLMQGVDLPRVAAAVFLANAVLLSVAALLLEGFPTSSGLVKEGGRGLMVELPMTLLLLWLTREIVPVRLAVRFVLVPLVAVAEGLVLLRPGLDVRLGIGAALMVLGSAVMLWGRSAESEAGLGLR